METIHKTDIWNVVDITSRPEPSSCMEEGAIHVPVTDEYDVFLMETKDVSPKNVEMQRMTEWALQIFLETTLDRRLKAILETQVVSLLETASHENSKE